MTAFIKAISYYLPAGQLTNDMLATEFPEWSVDKISDKTGIYSRRIASQDEFSSDLAIAACKKLFAEHNIQPESIDFILLCTQSPDYFLPTTACILQEKLNIPTHAGALDFNLGCSGYVYGLALCKGLISAGIAKNILLVTAETYTKFIHPRDKSNRTIFGDAAAATLIGADAGFAEIGVFELGTDGRGAENLIVRNGGLRSPSRSTSDRKDEFGNILNDSNLFMDGTEIFNFTSKAVPTLIKTLLKKAGLGDSNIDLYIFHQANRYMLNHLRKKLDIAEDKFFYFLEECGNTVSSTLPIATLESLKQGKLQGNVVLAGFGVGYSWGACMLSCTKKNNS